MTKKRVGGFLRRARNALGMTQRQLAGRVGVRASHIAYIENERRKPSLLLLRRIADALRLDRQELLLLIRPEARYFIGDRKESPPGRNDAWRRFVSNRTLLRRHNVTRAELRLLKHVTLVEHVSYPRHFIFILNSIRQAGVVDE
jgi:transcriptional regulator with XRE-family HTH domain